MSSETASATSSGSTCCVPLTSSTTRWLPDDRRHRGDAGVSPRAPRRFASSYSFRIEAVDLARYMNSHCCIPDRPSTPVVPAVCRASGGGGMGDGVLVGAPGGGGKGVSAMGLPRTLHGSRHGPGLPLGWSTEGRAVPSWCLRAGFEERARGRPGDLRRLYGRPPPFALGAPLRWRDVAPLVVAAEEHRRPTQPAHRRGRTAVAVRVHPMADRCGVTLAFRGPHRHRLRSSRRP